jgi:hypothetical protein
MKKGLKTLIAGILLFALGAIVVPLTIVIPFLLSDSDKNQFLVPGVLEVEVTEPGRYYLWNDHQTVFEGQSYLRSESIPDGATIRISNADGEDLTFTGNTSTTVTSGNSSKRSIGYVEVTNPEKLKVSVTGDFKERVFSFTKSIVLKMFGLIFAGVGVSMVLAVSGVGLAVWGIVKLARKEAPAE